MLTVLAAFAVTDLVDASVGVRVGVVVGVAVVGLVGLPFVMRSASSSRKR